MKMTVEEYIDFYHSLSAQEFLDLAATTLYDGEWCSAGTWYPCTILEDPRVPLGKVKIVTRNGTFLTEFSENVRKRKQECTKIDGLA